MEGYNFPSGVTSCLDKIALLSNLGIYEYFYGYEFLFMPVKSTRQILNKKITVDGIDIFYREAGEKANDRI